MKNGSQTVMHEIAMSKWNLIGGGEDFYKAPPPMPLDSKPALNIQGVIVAGDGHGNVGYALTAAVPVTPYVHIEAGIQGINGMNNKMIGFQAAIPFR